MFIEALSLVSQLYHMRMSRALEGLNMKYLLALCLSRFCRIYFWYTMSAKLMTFWYLIVADSLHTAMVISFFALYYLQAAQLKQRDGLFDFGRRVERED